MTLSSTCHYDINNDKLNQYDKVMFIDTELPGNEESTDLGFFSLDDFSECIAMSGKSR